MKMNKLGFAAAFALLPLGAQAATVGTFDVTAPISVRGGNAVSLWFETVLSEGFSKSFVLTEPGTFIADDVGATMTGSVVNRSNNAAGFDFSFEYDRDFSDNPDDTPEFKAVWEDVVEHGNEDFFDFEGGTVTGTGGFAGLNLSLIHI